MGKKTTLTAIPGFSASLITIKAVTVRQCVMMLDDHVT